MENFIERLQYYMKQKGINDNQMTIAAGLSVGLLGKAKNGGKGLSSSSIEKILLAYDDIDPNWLLTGRGQMLKTKSTSAPLPSCKESIPLSKDTNNITNKQDIIEKSNALVDPFLMLIRERDATIKEQAEEIGHLKEQIRQLTLKMEQLASNAHSPTTANVV